MIATSTLEVSSADQTLLLAPFGQADLNTLFTNGTMPLPPELIAYQPQAVANTYKTPEAFMAHEAKEGESQTWGIFDSERAALLGAITLSQADNHPGGPEYAHEAQTVGTQLFNRELRGRRIGTVAKIAVAKHAFDALGAQIIFANTAEGNTAAQRSLERSGFVLLDPRGQEEQLINGDTQVLQRWRVATESYIASYRSRRSREGLLAGAAVFATVSQDVNVTVR